MRRTGQALDSIGVSLQGQYAVRSERAPRSTPPSPLRRAPRQISLLLSARRSPITVRALRSVAS